MRQSAYEDQLAEVLVLRHQDALVLKRHSHEPLVAGRGIDRDGGEHVVSVRDQECLEGT